MEKLMRSVEQRVEQEMAAGGKCDEEVVIARVTEAMQREGVRCQQMRHDGSCRPTVRSKQISASPSLSVWRASAAPAAPPSSCGSVARRKASGLRPAPSAGMPRSRRRMSSRAAMEPELACALRCGSECSADSAVEQRFQEPEALDGATCATEAKTCWVAEDVVSHEQVSRMVRRSHARKECARW